MQLDACLHEYDALRRDIASYLSEVSRTYQWLMAVSAALIGAQILGQKWDSFSTTLFTHEALLFALAIGTLWFPAVYVSHWYDAGRAAEYIHLELWPRICRLSSSGGIVLEGGWEVWRGTRLTEDRRGMISIWISRMSAPCVPTVLAAMMFWRAAGESDRGWNVPEALGFGAWLLVSGAMTISWYTKVYRPEVVRRRPC
jgi:hypothetical protein